MPQENETALLELLVAPEDVALVEQSIAELEGIELETPIPSRDVVLGVAVLTLAAQATILITELVKLKTVLSEQEKTKDRTITVVIRTIDGKEGDLKDVDEALLRELLAEHL